MAEQKPLSRRDLLKSVGRWLAAPALVGTVASMAHRKGETCVNQTICKTCSIVATCGLPQALSFRTETGKDGTDGRR